MICVTICDFGYDACRHALRRCEKYLQTYPDLVAEVRLDLCGLTEGETQNLFLSSKVPLIATCRRRSRNLYLPAVLSGASYVDIDGIQSDARIRETLEELKGHRVKTIFSYTDYQKTPTLQELVVYVNNAASYGADIVKISTSAQSVEDSERLLELYRLQKIGQLPSSIGLVACSMGFVGSYSALDAYSMGAPLLDCSLDKRNQLYPGMLTVAELEKIRFSTYVSGSTVIPGSKDMTQKAVIASLLATGRSVLSNYSPCRDTEAALSLAKKRARSVSLKDDSLIIQGQGLKGRPAAEESSGGYLSSFKSLLSISSSKSSDDVNFVGESGLLARLCIPIVAQVGHQVSVTGEGRLLEREMTGCKDALSQLGASCILTSEDTLPAIINGPLSGSCANISAREGTQLVSGLIMALPLSKKDTVLHVADAADYSSLMETVELLKKFGIELFYTISGNSMELTVPGRQKYSSAEVKLEGDWSAAANFITAAAIFGQLKIYGLNIESTQRDKDILQIVKSAGAQVKCSKSCIEVSRGHLVHFDFDVSRNPDLFPVLAVLASYCEGTSVITGLSNVAYRQSQRVETICAVLRKMGVLLSLDDDVVTIKGICYARRLMEDRLLMGGEFNANGDHRVAMALKIAGIHTREKVSIEDMDCISKSYPQFKESLNSITRNK